METWKERLKRCLVADILQGVSTMLQEVIFSFCVLFLPWKEVTWIKHFTHTPRNTAFTLGESSIKTWYIFEIYIFRRTFWRKDQNRIYSRFWFIVLGIKQTAPSSENSKSFVIWNFLVGPRLRKKNVEKTQFF